MIWSISESKTFKRCQRQWYFKNYVASPTAKKDPIRREAYLLGKLQSISSWRGQLVDTVISEVIVPAVRSRQTVTLRTVKETARRLFDKQLECARKHRIREPGISPAKLGNDFAAFFCIEYEEGIPENEIHIAWREVELAFTNLFAMRELSHALKSSNYCIPQRALMFTHTGVTVRAVPDLILFYGDSPPVIVDWKVHVFGIQEAWLQLCTYALALTHCKPHSDFPSSVTNCKPWDIELIEAQLLKGQVRSCRPTEDDIQSAEAYIAESVSQMRLSADDRDREELKPTDFPTTSYSETCQKCPYRALCWEVANEPH